MAAETAATRRRKSVRSGQDRRDTSPLKRQGPLDPEIERAAQSFQYIREMTKVAYARERFSALDLPCFGSVLSSKFTR